jgi:hypothetical protein
MKYSYVFTVLFTLLSLLSYAQEQDLDQTSPELYSMPDKVKLLSFDTKFIRLNRVGFIDRISFEARQCGLKSDEKIVSLSINGQNFAQSSIKSKHWRTYVVTFADYGRELELKSMFDRGCIQVRNINILARRYSQRGHVGDHISYGTDAFHEVEYLKSMTDYLFHAVSASDRVRYLDPFTLVISDALAVLETSSGLSLSAREAVERVVRQLEVMQPLIEQLLRTPNESDVARELLLVKRRLSKLLEP